MDAARQVAAAPLGAGPNGARALPEECAVALSYDGAVHAVMMATPADLMDFALGFSLTEGIVQSPGDIEDTQIVPHPNGLEARMWLTGPPSAALAGRRRTMAGPVGCGLCGIESLAEALRPLPVVTADALRLTPDQAAAALASLRGGQPLHDETRAVHGAGFWTPQAGLVMAREDVGRHNALDKLIGALARAGIDPGTGAVVLSSRVSVEMVQKCAMAGAPVILAASAPTAHAVRLARGAQITVACRARGDGGLEAFSRPDRLGKSERDLDDPR